MLDHFAEQVRQHPAKIAIIQEQEDVTYQMLDRRANLLADTIRQKHTIASNYIGIGVASGHEFIVGILAILKLGYAYLPLDSTLPTSRLQEMLADRDTNLILTTNSFIKRFKHCGVELETITFHFIRGATNKR